MENGVEGNSLSKESVGRVLDLTKSVEESKIVKKNKTKEEKKTAEDAAKKILKEINPKKEYGSVKEMMAILKQKETSKEEKEDIEKALKKLGAAICLADKGTAIGEAVVKAELNTTILPDSLKGITAYVDNNLLVSAPGDEVGKEIVKELCGLEEINEKFSKFPNTYREEREKAIKKAVDELYNKAKEIESNSTVDTFDSFNKLGAVAGSLDSSLGSAEVIEKAADVSVEDKVEDGAEVFDEETTEAESDLSFSEAESSRFWERTKAKKDKPKYSPTVPLAVNNGEDGEFNSRPWEYTESDIGKGVYENGDLHIDVNNMPTFTDKYSSEEKDYLEMVIGLNDAARGLIYAGKDGDKILENRANYGFTHEHVNALLNKPEFRLVYSRLIHELCELYPSSDGTMKLRFKEKCYLIAKQDGNRVNAERKAIDRFGKVVKADEYGFAVTEDRIVIDKVKNEERRLAGKPCYESDEYKEDNGVYYLVAIQDGDKTNEKGEPIDRFGRVIKKDEQGFFITQNRILIDEVENEKRRKSGQPYYKRDEYVRTIDKDVFRNVGHIQSFKRDLARFSAENDKDQEHAWKKVQKVVYYLSGKQDGYRTDNGKSEKEGGKPIDKLGRVISKEGFVLDKDGNRIKVDMVDNEKKMKAGEDYYRNDQLKKVQESVFKLDSKGRKIPADKHLILAATAWNFSYAMGDTSAWDRMRVLPTWNKIISDTERYWANPEFKGLSKFLIEKSGKIKSVEDMVEAESFGGPVGDYILKVLRTERDLGYDEPVLDSQGNQVYETKEEEIVNANGVKEKIKVPDYDKPIFKRVETAIDKKTNKTMRQKILDGDFSFFPYSMFSGFLSVMDQGRDMNPNLGDSEKKENFGQMLWNAFSFDEDGKPMVNESYNKKGEKWFWGKGGNETTFMNEYRDGIEGVVTLYKVIAGKSEIKDWKTWGASVKSAIGMVNGVSSARGRYYRYTTDPVFLRDLMVGAFGYDSKVVSSDNIHLYRSRNKDGTLMSYSLCVYERIVNTLVSSNYDVDVNEVMRQLGVKIKDGERGNDWKVMIRNDISERLLKLKSKGLENKKENNLRKFNNNEEIVKLKEEVDKYHDFDGDKDFEKLKLTFRLAIKQGANNLQFAKDIRDQIRDFKKETTTTAT